MKDFKRIRLESRYYVDKTAFIRKMEERADFSLVGKYPGDSWQVRFEQYLDTALRNLIDGHRELLAKVTDVDGLIALPNAGVKYDAVVPLLKRLGYGLYVIVDFTAGGTPVHFICYEFRGRDLVRLEEVFPS